MESKIIYDSSIDQGLIKSMKVAVIGFGSQGHAHSLNLHESGVDITVGLREDSESFKRAQDMGLQVANLEDATKNADVVMLLLPDQIMADVYNDQIASHIKEGATLLFAHGFNIHFNEIVPREDLSVAMVAPKGPGHLLRRTYSEGSGMPCLVAVHKDASGNTENLAMSYASAIGGGRAGILRTTFKEETETDLFGEQTVLCGGLVELIKNGYETLVEAGYEPEMAYFETVHEVKLIVDLIYEGGIANMNYSISNTAEYGEYQSGPRVINKEETKKRMKEVLDDIQSGKFTKQWMEECKNGQKNFLATRAKLAEHPVEKVGANLRAMMPWIGKKKLVDSDKK